MCIILRAVPSILPYATKQASLISTVQSHVVQIYQKAGVTSKAGLTRLLFSSSTQEKRSYIKLKFDKNRIFMLWYLNCTYL